MFEGNKKLRLAGVETNTLGRVARMDSPRLLVTDALNSG